MAISAKDVMQLRQRTGLGMMECKKALAETDGDMDAAIELLRKTVGDKMNERSDREAAEGAIAAAANDGAAAIVQLISETDFSAKSEAFMEGADKIAELALDAPEGDVEPTDEINAIVENLRLTIKENISVKAIKKITGEKTGKYVHHNRKMGVIIAGEGPLEDELLTGICQHISAAVPPLMPEPKAIDADGLPAEEVEAARAEFKQEALNSGKPENIVEKMLEGKMRKWQDEQTLMGQDYIRDMDNKKPIREYLPKGARITAYARLAIGG